MGYSVPAAVGAKITFPDRMVVSMVGDGGFMMTGQEIATAFHHGVAPIMLVFNNQMYGTIRMHQERAYPWRVSGTALTNPDFCKYIEAFGGHGEVVTDTEEFSLGVPARRRERQTGADRIAHEPGADHHSRHDRRLCGAGRKQPKIAATTSCTASTNPSWFGSPGQEARLNKPTTRGFVGVNEARENDQGIRIDAVSRLPPALEVPSPFFGRPILRLQPKTAL